MNDSFLEITPVTYNASGIIINHLTFPAHSKCFEIHWHDRMEFLRIKSGKLYVKHGTDFISASVGELIIISPKILHMGYTLDEGVEYDVLMFDVRTFYNKTDICMKFLPAIFNGDVIFKTVTSLPETINSVDSICKFKDGVTMEIVPKIYSLLYAILQNDILALRTHPVDAVVKKIMRYLEENATLDINLDTLCKEFGYSSAHLCRKFKKITGLPPMTYLKIYRLELAINKIKNSNISMSEIAQECGFSDANYFTRCFKNHFGLSPIQYRKAHK